jgi:hypothetical protein
MLGTLLALAFALSDPPQPPRAYETEVTPLEGPEDPDIAVMEAKDAPADEEVPSYGGPQLRSGIGGWAALGSAGTTALGALGVSLRLGFEIHDGVACYVQGQATTALLAGWYSLALLGELPLNEHVAVAAGMGVAGGYGFLDNSSITHGAFSVGMPFRVGFSVGGSARHRLVLSLDGWVGEDPGNLKAGLNGYAGVGLSFEMM